MLFYESVTLRGLSLLHINPLASLCRFENSITDVLRAEGVAEIRVSFLSAWVIEALHELDSAVDKRVLVAEAETRDPPVSGVGVVAIGDVDAGPATGFTGYIVVEVRKTVEVVEVPREGLFVAVDLEGLE